MKRNFFSFYWRKWGKMVSVVCFASLVLLMASCLDEDDQANEPIPVAYVSIYHGSPNAPELDVFVDDRQVNRLEFTDYTGYLNFYTGDRHFEINPFNASNALIDTTVTFTDGAFYSIFIVNNLSNVEALTVRDSASAPSSGKVKIRFINLSPDAGAFDVTATEGSAPLFAGQAFKQPSNFVEIDAAESSFVLKPAEGSDELVSVSDVELQPGKFYTIIARGFATPPSGNNNELSLEIITN
jgi:Domain of unknown function (DUF4397)